MNRQDEQTHPAFVRLEAMAAGNEDGSTRAHLATCARCSEYVRDLTAEAHAFREGLDGEAFAHAVLARAERTPGRSVAAARARPRRVFAVAASALLAAAVLFFVLGRRGSRGTLETGSPAVASLDPPQDIHFKGGGPAVVAIRERDGTQERFTGSFEVQPEDRVRVEVALDRPQALVVGLLFDDGAWTPLLEPTLLTPGPHLSELAARFDATPTDAELLVGGPEEVARARSTRQFAGVVAWRVRSRTSSGSQ